MTHTLEPWMPVGATKPKDDIANIAAREGWQILTIDRAKQDLDVSNLTSQLQPSDLVVHQFPSYLSIAFEENFQAAVQASRAKFILLLHDFEPLRLNERQMVDREWQLLKQADGLVVHTQEMADAINIPVPTFQLGLFDYLTELAIPARSLSQDLIFAGTLTKAPWIKNFPLPLKVFANLPRKWAQDVLPTNIRLENIMPANEAPAKLPDGIGLVWDSDEDDKTQYQSYQAINSPHKLSLYLAANLPVILPATSPFTTFITENHLGLGIHDLTELPVKFDYDASTGQQIGQALRSGQHTKRLLTRLLEYYY